MTAKEIEMWYMLKEIKQKCENYNSCEECPFRKVHKFPTFAGIGCSIGRPYLNWEVSIGEESREVEN